MRAPIIFVAREEILSEWGDTPPCSASDVDAFPGRFRRGESNWIVQTYALLREELERSGFEVALRSTFQPSAIAIAHRDALNTFSSDAHRCRVIGVRADRPPIYGIEREIVQNDVVPDSPVRRYIAHWPQPALLPRDPGRGSRVDHVVYFGRVQGTTTWMRSEAFRSKLAGEGVTFRIADRDWNDYRDVDAILSARDMTPRWLATKPASKLTNAWLAGVPALLGDEPAFRSLRRSELDYDQVNTADDAVAAILKLRREPDRYQAMVRNGLERSRGFTREVILQRWLDVITEMASQPAPRTSWARYAASLIRQKIEGMRYP